YALYHTSPIDNSTLSLHDALPISVWHEYEFRGKPGDPYRRPPQVAPYHLRLDWLMWFVALSAQYGRRWLPELAAKLLAADRTTLDRKSTRLNSSHVSISYAVFCLK